MVTLEITKSFYYVIPRIIRTLQESRASNYKSHLDCVITEIYSKFSEMLSDRTDVKINISVLSNTSVSNGLKNTDVSGI